MNYTLIVQGFETETYHVSSEAIDQYAVGSVRTLAKAIAAHYDVDFKYWLSIPWPVLAIVYSSIAEGLEKKSAIDLMVADVHPNSDATGVYTSGLDVAYHQDVVAGNDSDDDGA